MGKDRETKVIIVIALVIGVIGLSVGFASFSSLLTINNNTATVTPSDKDFKVFFTEDLSATLVDSNNTGTSFSADLSKIVTTKSEGVTASSSITINNTSNVAPTLSGLSAGFTEPGQSITYTFYAKNVGGYDAYLKTLSLNEVTSGKYITCTPTNTGIADSSDNLIKNACKYITATVNVYAADGSVLATSVLGDTPSNVTNSFSENNLIKYTNNQSNKVEVTIAYLNSAKVDEKFDVTFGSVTLGYSSVN